MGGLAGSIVTRVEALNRRTQNLQHVTIDDVGVSAEFAIGTVRRKCFD